MKSDIMYSLLESSSMEKDKIYAGRLNVSMTKRSEEDCDELSCEGISPPESSPTDPFRRVDVLPTIVIIDDSECVVTEAANIESCSHIQNHNAVESPVNNLQMMNRDQAALHASSSASLAHRNAPPRTLNLPEPHHRLQTRTGLAKQSSETEREDWVKAISANGIEIVCNHNKRKQSRARKMDYFHRRSHSHPEQLNLMSEDDDTNCWGELGNGDANNPSLLRKHSLPHEKFYPFIEKETKFCASSELNRDNQAAADNGFADPLSDTEKDEEENLWNRPSEFKLRDQFYSFFQASDNKLAMKLFGSRNALLKEKKRQMEARTWIIHPCSNFRLYWDLLMLIFLITNLIVLPVSIAFFYDDVGLHWIVFNITCDTMFILDILINFRTGLIDPESHGHVILDPKAIALRYVKTWFVVDFISSLPLDYVFLGLDDQPYSAGRALRILRLAKLLQLLRLLRISRLVRYVRLWKEFFSLASIVVKLFNLICVMVLMGHWSGCIQFFVPVIQGLPKDSWIVLNNLQKADWWEQYSKALFKALSHMLCIGYGEFPPRNMTDTWLTIASMLAGATCYALFIGHATTLIQSFDTSSRQFRDHLQQVNEYMIYRKLPGELRRRITDYYEHRFGGKLFDEAAILSEISDCLRKDVIHHNCKELVRSVPFFLKADESFVTDVITKLQFEMFQPSDIIIKAGTKGDRMFFIQEGLIEILTDGGKIVTRLGDGSYFGEICLLTRKCRTATVRAASYCNLFSLSKEHFDKILENYPLMRRTLETIAAKRLHKLGKDPNLVTSRESLLDDIDGIQKVFEGSDDDSCDDSDQGSSPTLSRESNSQFLTVVRSFFTKDSEEFSPTSRAPSMKSGISPSQQLPRCKSALNNTLNHLVLVPQGQGKTKLGRAKSAADVADNSSFLSQRLFTPGDGRRPSLSPGKKRKAKQEKLGTPNPSNMWNKVNQRNSQPGSPCIANSGRITLTASANDVCKHPVTPQLMLTAQSNSTIAMPEEEYEERVKFSLSEDV